MEIQRHPVVEGLLSVDHITPPELLARHVILGIAHIGANRLAEAGACRDGGTAGSEVDSEEDGFGHGFYGMGLNVRWSSGEKQGNGSVGGDGSRVYQE